MTEEPMFVKTDLRSMVCCPSCASRDIRKATVYFQCLTCAYFWITATPKEGGGMGIQLETWGGDIPYADLEILFHELANQRVSVIGEPMGGTPMAFILTDNFAKSDDLVAELEKVIAAHIEKFAPAPA